MWLIFLTLSDIWHVKPYKNGELIESISEIKGYWLTKCCIVHGSSSRPFHSIRYSWPDPIRSFTVPEVILSKSICTSVNNFKLVALSLYQNCIIGAFWLLSKKIFVHLLCMTLQIRSFIVVMLPIYTKSPLSQFWHLWWSWSLIYCSET